MSRRQRHRQHGIGMLEVLIAVLIVSIGFLGMAALQAKALSTNNGAMSRSMATIASYSILDAMRADLNNAEGGAYNFTVAANACHSLGAAGIARTQMLAWCMQLADRFGAVASTTGRVACTRVSTTVANTADCTVTITYDDSRSGSVPSAGGTSGGASAIQTIVTRAQL